MEKFKISELDLMSMNEKEAMQNVILNCEFVGINLVEFLSFNNNIVEIIVETTEEEISTYYEKFNKNNNFHTYYEEII